MKKNVFGMNLVGPQGVNAENDFELGENEQGKACMKLGTTEFTEEDLGGDGPWQSGSGLHSIQAKNGENYATGDYSLAEGYGSHAQANYSSARGFICRTLKDEGDGIDARYSRADGYMTDAAGIASSADGDTTYTQNIAEHAQGRGNKSHKDSNGFGSAGNTIFSIGIASNNQDITTFKNAVEVMQNGDMYVYGVGGYNGVDIDDASTLQESIGGGGSAGVLTVIREQPLNYSEEDENFTGSFSESLLPSDFYTPGKYNLIVYIAGFLGEAPMTYTANHFCCMLLKGDLHAFCYDRIGPGTEDDIIHDTKLYNSDSDNIIVDYVGKIGSSTGIDTENATFSVYLQPLF